MKFIRIEGVYYNVNYIKSVRVVRSDKGEYEAEAEVVLEIEGGGRDCFGFKNWEDAEIFQYDIMRQMIV
jgi:hypothetical protein